MSPSYNVINSVVGIVSSQQTSRKNSLISHENRKLTHTKYSPAFPQITFTFYTTFLKCQRGMKVEQGQKHTCIYSHANTQTHFNICIVKLPLP